ncbi:hypothetical protein M9458_008330, partial [Cirrhinus mrigala]
LHLSDLCSWLAWDTEVSSPGLNLDLSSGSPSYLTLAFQACTSVCSWRFHLVTSATVRISNGLVYFPHFL